MSESSRDQQVQTILHAYLQALDRGEKPDRQKILDNHPDFRSELAEYFADASKLDRMAKSLQTATFGGDPVLPQLVPSSTGQSARNATTKPDSPHISEIGRREMSIT